MNVKLRVIPLFSTKIMLERYVKSFPKARLKTELFNKLREKATTLVEGLNSLDATDENGGKAMYYLSELKKVGENWSDIISDESDVYSRILKESSFEEGGNSFGYPIRTTLNCPSCGLEPLVNAPETRMKLSEHYCNKCGKFVVFSKPNFKPFRCKVRVTDDLIIVL